MMVSLVMMEGDLRKTGKRNQEIFAVMLNLGWCSTSAKKNSGHQVRCRLAYLRYFLFKYVCFWKIKLYQHIGVGNVLHKSLNSHLPITHF